MAEGGQYPWKRQVIDQHRGPAASYNGMKESLPRPPAGQVWVQDLETKVWSLEAEYAVTVVPANNNENDSSEGGNQASFLSNDVPLSLPNPPNGKRWVQAAIEHEKREHLTVNNNNNKNNNNNNNNNYNEWRLVDCDDDEKSTKQQQEQQRQFLEHKVGPSDTFQGLCLRYRITPTELRQSNRGFSGTNLLLAPNPLRIPLPVHGNIAISVFDIAESSANDKKSIVKKLQKACGYVPSSGFKLKLTPSEAKCYLELNDWDYQLALDNAREDIAMDEASENNPASCTQQQTKNTEKKNNYFLFC